VAAAAGVGGDDVKFLTRLITLYRGHTLETHDRAGNPAARAPPPPPVPSRRLSHGGVLQGGHLRHWANGGTLRPASESDRQADPGLGQPGSDAGMVAPTVSPCQGCQIPCSCNQTYQVAEEYVSAACSRKGSYGRHGTRHMGTHACLEQHTTGACTALLRQRSDACRPPLHAEQACAACFSLCRGAPFRARLSSRANLKPYIFSKSGQRAFTADAPRAAPTKRRTLDLSNESIPGVSPRTTVVLFVVYQLRIARFVQAFGKIINVIAAASRQVKVMVE
jgi:hypothetical protein